MNAGGMRLKDGECLIVISDKSSGIIKACKARWNIETMSGNLKSRGTGFEDTRLKDPERISKLLSLLTLTFCYSSFTFGSVFNSPNNQKDIAQFYEVPIGKLLYTLQTGVWRITQGKTIAFKKTLNRPLKSIFRHGLDYLRELLFDPIGKLQEFMRLPEFLSCT